MKKRPVVLKTVDGKVITCDSLLGAFSAIHTLIGCSCNFFTVNLQGGKDGTLFLTYRGYTSLDLIFNELKEPLFEWKNKSDFRAKLKKLIEAIVLPYCLKGEYEDWSRIYVEARATGRTHFDISFVLAIEDADEEIVDEIMDKFSLGGYYAVDLSYSAVHCNFG